MSNVTGSPVEITLKDREYLLHPLSDYRIGGVVLWIRSDFIRSARMSDPDPSQMTEVFAYSRTIQWWDKTSVKLLTTRRGRVELFRASLKDPIDIEAAYSLFCCYDEHGKVIPNHEKLSEFFDLFCLVNDLGPLPKKGAGSDADTSSPDSSIDYFTGRAARYERLFTTYGILPDKSASLTPEMHKVLDGEASPLKTFDTQEEFEQWHAQQQQKQSST